MGQNYNLFKTEADIVTESRRMTYIYYIVSRCQDMQLKVELQNQKDTHCSKIIKTLVNDLVQ